jgi:hypothetical protein
MNRPRLSPEEAKESTRESNRAAQACYRARRREKTVKVDFDHGNDLPQSYSWNPRILEHGPFYDCPSMQFRA